MPATLRISAQEREALRTLPRLIQDKVFGALRGSVEDLRYVVAHLNQLRDAMPLLLPVFHTQLEACLVPDGVSPDVVPAIMLAKLSLDGIVQICKHVGKNMDNTERLVHDAVASKWEILFPWMQFFSNNFLPSSQGPPVLPHVLPISTYEALRITVHPLSALCEFTEVGCQLMRTNPAVQAFFFRIWVIVDGLKSDVFADPLRPGDKSLAVLMRANLCSISVTCLNEYPASAPLSIVASAAGGIAPMASLALRYIRRMAKDIANMPEPLERTIGNLDFSIMIVCATSLSQAIIFMQSLVGGCQELLLRIGAIRTVLHVVTTLWERLLTPAWNSSDSEPDVGLAMRRHVLYKAYRYIGYSMNYSHDPASVISQALQHGLLECLLRTGTSPAERVDNVKRFEDDPDLRLLNALPRFFVFSKVLRSLGPALQRVNKASLAGRASEDPVLWELWQAVYSSAHDISNVYELPEGVPFYRYQCGSSMCSRNFSKDDVTAYRCSGCLLTHYCSKSCQKDAWESGHRVHCRMLHSAVGWILVLCMSKFFSDTLTQGNDDVRDIRESLPIIAMVESRIFDQRLNEIKALYRSTRDMAKASNDRFVIEVDMSFFPGRFNICPLGDYSSIGGIGSHDTFEHGIADLVTTSEDSPYDLVAVKVRLGKDCHSLFSPVAALGIAFGWTSGIQGGRYIHGNPPTADARDCVKRPVVNDCVAVQSELHVSGRT
ncbi:hypothetical protein AZE42_04702 [Rhizopogon vesiculosus]|uniref:MYND-type domain-containing protein n=1 Tax=Rhizopogon vesiculosus TaxID=180088 RepID=A0A1J8QH75_9AGAM|nr:hypothetical protein AZE42_04702 [Rhizopogon vesiculosus]